MPDGFLGRWARRKEAVRRGEPVAAEPEAAPPAPVALAPAPASLEPVPAPEAPPLPTLEEARALTPESDFARFVRPDVAPDVKNAALKKLFADPRFNVQDGLDTYIDDYSKPDPLPPAMLRQLASAKFLKLFDEEEGAGGEAVAQSGLCNELPTLPKSDDADPDLRLQQDDAPGPRGPGAGSA